MPLAVFEKNPYIIAEYQPIPGVTHIHVAALLVNYPGDTWPSFHDPIRLCNCDGLFFVIPMLWCFSSGACMIESMSLATSHCVASDSLHCSVDEESCKGAHR